MYSKTISYITYLISDTRRRHKHVRLKDKIVSFTVQLEVLTKNSWFPVVRYDTAHGYAHKHLYHYNKEPEKTPLFLHNYTDALDFADADIKTNWELYCQRFLKEAEND